MSASLGLPLPGMSSGAAAAAVTAPTAYRSKIEDDIEAERKAFTSWINSKLAPRGLRVQDLFRDLSDGKALYNILEVLSGESLKVYGRLSKGNMRIQHVANMNIVFRFIRTHIPSVDVDPIEVVDCNPRAILGLVWGLIVHFTAKGARGSAGLSPHAHAHGGLSLVRAAQQEKTRRAPLTPPP